MVYALVFLDIIPRLSTRHPFRDKLKRIKRDTLERYDIWVVETFPYDDLLTKPELSEDGAPTEGRTSGVPG